MVLLRVRFSVGHIFFCIIVFAKDFSILFHLLLTGPEVDKLASAAARYKIHLVMGVIERSGGTLYCSVIFFDSQGQYLGKHRKLMPTAAERIIWGFGDGSTLPVLDTQVGRIGALICWENRMPLLRTAMYAKGELFLYFFISTLPLCFIL